MNLMSLTKSVGEGAIGVRVQFGAPIMQRMPDLSLAWHWQCNVYYIFIVLYLFTTSHSTGTPLLGN
jgi:hypothetical protein